MPVAPSGSHRTIMMIFLLPFLWSQFPYFHCLGFKNDLSRFPLEHSVNFDPPPPGLDFRRCWGGIIDDDTLGGVKAIR